MKKGGFACKVFCGEKMKKYLPRRTYLAMTGKLPLRKKDREIFARGLLRWAKKQGATRFAHWFLPLNNFAASKRDSLFSVDGKGNAVQKFCAKQLQQGESDASSFPSGGLRQTFEARGITAWDETSHPFVRDGCLFVPTTFCSFCGETLDKKTPLLKSVEALNKQALRLLKLCGTPCKKVTPVVGAEQEYFLIDKCLFERRTDLLNVGRTLVGAMPPKAQQLKDHYCCLPDKTILQFWQEVDKRLWELGIVVKTEHCEVAPRQFELAPCYAPVQLACDQNQIVAETLQTVAEESGLACLLHEKPFEGFNGSGKHNNWSLLTNTGENLFEQGNTPQLQGRFLLFLAAVIKAVDLHADLLGCAVSSLSNDCRLGGFEAPPRVISVFLGLPVAKLFDGNWKMGRDTFPPFCGTDRNRTSPFAFTGNKFEFRTVGASANLADSNTVLNVAMADVLQGFADKLAASTNFWEDAQKLVQRTFEEHGKVIFEGNNYSPVWQQESKQRGLPQTENTVQAALALTKSQNVRLFERHGVFSASELQALQKVMWQNYRNAVTVEANTLAELCKQIAFDVRKHIDFLQKFEQKNCTAEKVTVQRQREYLNKMLRQVSKLKQLAKLANDCDCHTGATICCKQILPCMQQIRKCADKLEQLCPAQLWSLPTYSQILCRS